MQQVRFYIAPAKWVYLDPGDDPKVGLNFLPAFNIFF